MLKHTETYRDFCIFLKVNTCILVNQRVHIINSLLAKCEWFRLLQELFLADRTNIFCLYIFLFKFLPAIKDDEVLLRVFFLSWA